MSSAQKSVEANIPPIRTPSRSPSPDSEYSENYRPSTSTRRPPPNTSSEALRLSSPIDEPAPKYNESPTQNPPPDITQDSIPPHYRFDSPAIPPFFQAIIADDDTELTQLLSSNPDLVNQKDPEGRTPLYRAVIAYDGRIDTVRLLLEAGADVDAWSTEIIPGRHRLIKPKHPSQRTSLMAASARNRLPIVRLLLSPPYNANTTLVAPDGQHALRLASSAGAKEIVALLPSLRAGGWKRMKTRAKPHIEVIKKTAKVMYDVGKVFVWHIPKFFVWTLPKHAGLCVWEVLKFLGKCVADMGKSVWGGVKKIPGVMKRFGVWLPGATLRGIKAVPGALWRLCKALWEVVVVKVPKAAVEVWKFLVKVVKWVWNLLTVRVPRFTVTVVKWFWNLLTVRIPRFTVAVMKWFWMVIKEVAKWVWKIITVRIPKVSKMIYHAIVDAIVASWHWFVEMLGTVASLLHTFVSFILRKCTLSNLIQGIKQTLHFFFISVPKTIWEAVKGTYDLCYRVVKGLFGTLGWFFWNLGECLVESVLWFPTMIGRILVNFGQILGGVWKEIRLWVNPKANV